MQLASAGEVEKLAECFRGFGLELNGSGYHYQTISGEGMLILT